MVARKSVGLIQDSELLSARQAELIDAATVLFIKNGFHKTSIRQIAEATGWSMGTLYLYINRKEDILHLVSEYFMSNFNHRLASFASRERSDGEVLEPAMRDYIYLCDELRGHIKLLYRESASMLREHLEAIKDHEASMVALFQSLIENGDSGVADPASRIIGQNIIFMGHMWALKGWALRPVVSIDEYVDQQVNIILASMEGQ